MHRVDGQTAADILPVPQPVGPKPNGYFQDQTIVDQDFMNALQEEFCRFIESQGIALDKTNYNQFLAALEIYSSAANLLTKLLTVDGAASGLDADVLQGAAPSDTQSASTIVKRTVAGEVKASYFQTTANFTTLPATSVMIETDSDGFIRRQTPAQFIANQNIALTSDYVTGVATIELPISTSSVVHVDVNPGLGDVEIDFGASIIGSSSNGFDLGIASKTTVGIKQTSIWGSFRTGAFTGTTTPGHMVLFGQNISSASINTITVNWWAKKR